jgi:DNA polymerase-3 subunit gamma/tau
VAPAQRSAVAGYEDLPPLDAYDDSGSDYEEYLSQGFSDAAASAPMPNRVPAASAGPAYGQAAPAQAPARASPNPDDLPPWDLDGTPAARAQVAPVVPSTSAAPATPRVVAASEPQPVAASVMETIDWDELESDSQPEEGEGSPD